MPKPQKYDLGALQGPKRGLPGPCKAPGGPKKPCVLFLRPSGAPETLGSPILVCYFGVGDPRVPNTFLVLGALQGPKNLPPTPKTFCLGPCMKGQTKTHNKLCRAPTTKQRLIIGPSRAQYRGLGAQEPPKPSFGGPCMQGPQNPKLFPGPPPKKVFGVPGTCFLGWGDGFGGLGGYGRKVYYPTIPPMMSSLGYWGFFGLF